MYVMSIFLRSLGAMISAGVPIPVAYTRASKTLFFEPLRLDLVPQIDRICSGVALSTCLNTGDIPTHIVSLAMAGEASGSLGSSLLKSAVMLDRDMSHLLKRLTSLIEPIMMVCMGGIVGSIALSIMMPIYDMSRVLQQIN